MNNHSNEAVAKGAQAGQQAADNVTRAAKSATEGGFKAGYDASRASTDAARQSAETVQDSMMAGINTAAQTFRQVTDQVTRTLGFAEPQSQELARKSSQNLEAVTQAASVLAQGAQEISREWFGLAQGQLKKNMDALNALTRCRSLQDMVTVQSDLLRTNLQQAIDDGRRLSEVSVRVAQDATRTITSQSNAVPVSRAA